MLKFTTISPIYNSSSLKEFYQTKPLISLESKTILKNATIKGSEAIIKGKALKLAGFSLPRFYEGDISELDNKYPEILMVLPSGEYPINVRLTSKGIYLLDLK